MLVRPVPDRRRNDEEVESGRLLLLGTAAVLGITLIGFVSGTNPGRYVAETPTRAPAADTQRGDIAPARSHSELTERPWGAEPLRSGWAQVKAVGLASYTAPLEPIALERGRSSGPQTGAAIMSREARRAYEGAPPVIPHPIRQSGAVECLACHADGFSIAGAEGGPLPHADYQSCTQCHVVAAAPFTVLPPNPAARAGSSFEGLRPPAGGERAYPGAPPVMPHSTWMRGRCATCHGATAKSGLHTRHPERRSCTQCHAPSAELEQGPVLSAGLR